MPVDTNYKNKWIGTLNKSLSDKFPFWVLFQNGTYVIVEEDKPSSIQDVVIQGVRALMQHQRTKQTIYTIDQDIHYMEEFSLWVVPNEAGIYTLVSPHEFQVSEPSEIALMVKGRNKCLQDCEEKNVLHVSCPDQFCACSAAAEG